jgi:hypothetical protein
MPHRKVAGAHALVDAASPTAAQQERRRPDIP